MVKLCKKFAEFLRAMEGYEGSLIVRCALRLAPLFFVWPGDLRQAEWADINLETAEWRYLVTKTQTLHIVPLCTQAVARTILGEVLGVRPDFIEHQLAHAVRDPNGRAYNRTAHLPERSKMMQQWGIISTSSGWVGN